eukprot:364054-Chlamydomonas_euryale.AAC.9
MQAHSSGTATVRQPNGPPECDSSIASGSLLDVRGLVVEHGAAGGSNGRRGGVSMCVPARVLMATQRQQKAHAVAAERGDMRGSITCTTGLMPRYCICA